MDAQSNLNRTLAHYAFKLWVQEASELSMLSKSLSIAATNALFVDRNPALLVKPIPGRTLRDL